MGYADTRDSEQLRILAVRIAEFVWRYKSNPSTGRRRTLFLFPGGMGCQLLRAQTPYQGAIATPQTFSYDKVWLTLGTFLGDALTLKMHKDPGDPPGVKRDLDDRMIIADDAVELFGITPYDRFTAWCELNGLDWFIFGWDWRRRLEDTVSFFLTQFLPLFRNAIQNQCNADPLGDFVLVGHSFGGMIVNLILRQYNSLLANLTRAITVAAPFYGYDGQIHRWFEGDPYLNHLGKMNVIRVISSLPACYTLLYADTSTYAAIPPNPLDPYPLAAYPSVDAVNAAQTADPFNPVGQRYPSNTGFDTAELAHALQIYRQLAAKLLQNQHADQFFNIRGVQTADATIGGIDWSLLLGLGPNPPNSPIADRPPPVAGDGVQPAWSTRLATQPHNKWVEVKGDIDHMFMMEYDDTHQAIAGVL